MEKKAGHEVEWFFEKTGPWQAEYQELRRIMLGSAELTEELKWGKPCYTFEGSNIVLMHGFKEYCALLFIKGSLIKDEQHILTQQTENVQAARQMRFTGVEQIKALESVITAYVKEAIEIEKAGLEVDFKPTAEYAIPQELQSKFDELPALKTAFEMLPPGRQRGYILHFSQPKQAKTRSARVGKYVQQIFEGKGLND